MMKIWLLAAVLLLATSCACLPVEVTEENLGDVMKAPDVLLFFVAGDTAPAKKTRQIAAATEEYAKTLSDSFAVGIIDVHVQSRLEREFRPQVGQVYYYKDGEIHSRTMPDPRQPHLVEEWIESHHSRSLQEITTKEEFDRFVDDVDNKHATVVIFGGSREDAFHNRLLELSHAFHDTFYFRVVFDEEVIAHALPSPDDREKNVWIFRHFEKESGDIGRKYTDGDDFDTLVRWLLLESSPLVHKFGRDEVSTIAAYYKEHMVIMHMREEDVNTLEMVYHVAAEKERYKSVGFFWQTPQMLESQLEAMGYNELKGHIPFPVCTTKAQRAASQQSRQHASAPILWDPKVPVTRATFSAWVDKIISGELSEKNTAQSASSVTQEEGRPLKLVRSTLDEALKKPGNLLLFITAPVKVCGGECLLLESVIEKQMIEHELAASITFAQIDGMKNYVGDIDNRVPSLSLFKDGEQHLYTKMQKDERSIARWIDSVLRPKKRAHDEF